jgi:hypothetical protein
MCIAAVDQGATAHSAAILAPLIRATIRVTSRPALRPLDRGSPLRGAPRERAEMHHRDDRLPPAEHAPEILPQRHTMTCASFTLV